MCRWIPTICSFDKFSSWGSYVFLNSNLKLSNGLLISITYNTKVTSMFIRML